MTPTTEIQTIVDALWAQFGYEPSLREVRRAIPQDVVATDDEILRYIPGCAGFVRSAPWERR